MYNQQLLEKLIRYVKVETTAGEYKKDSVSNDKILDLSKIMMDELKELHPDDLKMNKYGTVYARFNGDNKKESVALLAHLDTSPDASGKNVKPKVTIYNGKKIKIKNDLFLSEDLYPWLKNAIGHEILITNGNTLLGGDDKAGIAIIMTAIEKIINENISHRPFEVILTTDEEIGFDASHVTIGDVKSKYGYTVDGGDYKEISVETFDAASMEVNIIGKPIHPGLAKNRMVNAINVLNDFHNSLPRYLRPEYTLLKEPFFHMEYIEGNVSKATAKYLIRSFSKDQLDTLKDLAEHSAKIINENLGYTAIELSIVDQYRNMKVALDDQPQILDEIEKVYKKVGIDFSYLAVRGGTTGSELSFMGLPCPNLGTGDYNMHSTSEYVDLFECSRMVEVIRELLTKNY